MRTKLTAQPEKVKDWIAVHYLKGFVCDRCKVEEKIPMPIPVNVWLLWAKNFIQRHKRCR